MGPFIGIFFTLATLLAVDRLEAGADCKSLLARVWTNDSRPYKVWDPKVSTVAVKPMVDRKTIHSPHFSPIRIMMGAARITQNLPLHQHEETEIYYILKGRGRTFVTTREGTDEFEIEAGSFFYLPTGVPHYTVADPHNPIELLYIFPRGALEDVRYVFDGSLPISKEAFMRGQLPLLKEYPLDVKERVLIHPSRGEVMGQVMKHLLIPPRKIVDHRVEGSGRILFVRRGQGLIRLESREVPLTAGSYLYLGEGAAYTLKSTHLHGLDILIFE
ncbi:MAG: cupin domain-containing protein [Bacteriovoracales bacterium]|nr:cupin domain-containing protein [Bacteriovoracales bacterium]